MFIYYIHILPAVTQKTLLQQATSLPPDFTSNGPNPQLK